MALLVSGLVIPVGGTGAGAIITGDGVATAVCAAIGVGVGTIIRSQVAAIIAVLALLYLAELLRHRDITT